MTAIIPHQLCHGNSSDDRRRVLLEGSANASKDASKILEALLKPSMATVTADRAAGVTVRSLLLWWRVVDGGGGLSAVGGVTRSKGGVDRG